MLDDSNFALAVWGRRPYATDCPAASNAWVNSQPDGAVAQLGERYNGIVEVRGSIPLGSTNHNALILPIILAIQIDAH